MNEVISLRVAHAEDADAIRALTREAYAKWVGLTGREPLPMRVDYARMRSGSIVLISSTSTAVWSR